jgi:hypothetical protein
MASNSSAATPKPIKVRSAAKSTTRVKAAKPAATAVAADGTAVAIPKPRRRTKVETRTRVYWAVFNSDLKRVAVFEFHQEEEAKKRADKLTQATGGPHFIQKIKAIVKVENP